MNKERSPFHVGDYYCPYCPEGYSLVQNRVVETKFDGETVMEVSVKCAHCNHFWYKEIKQDGGWE